MEEFIRRLKEWLDTDWVDETNIIKFIDKLAKEYFERCFICGKKAVTEHHTTPKKKGGSHKVPLCEKHHINVEQLKIAIEIMNREKRVCVKRFRQIIDNLRENKKEGII